MKIKLRSITENDSPKLFKWVNDPELIGFTNYFKPVSEVEHKNWFNSIFEKKDQVLFGIEDEEKELLIGTCGLFQLDFISRKAELRIKLGDKNYWGSGAGTEAVKLLIKYGFENLNMNRIWLKVMEDNQRASKSYEKVGFIIEGKLIKDMFVNNEYKNIILMGLLNE